MDLLTYAQIKANIQRETDTETEDFIQPLELLQYVNEGIDKAEAEIHALGMEDEYFLSRVNLALVQGQEEYDLPSDIYANKIRRIMYANGSTIFPINRSRKKRFDVYTEFKQFPPGTNYYEYFIFNPTAGAKPKLLLMPQAQETSAANVKIWYIRNANTMVDDDSVCDIPEFHSFIEKYAKWKIYFKEGNPAAADAAAELQADKTQMIETLQNMVPDDNSQIEGDLSHYQEMS